jgi:hypothetical protein
MVLMAYKQKTIVKIVVMAIFFFNFTYSQLTYFNLRYGGHAGV